MTSKRATPKPLTCAYGEPWMGDHPKCRAAHREGVRAFWRDVMDGKYDRHGYTPAERAMKRSRDRRRRMGLE